MSAPRILWERKRCARREEEGRDSRQLHAGRSRGRLAVASEIELKFLPVQDFAGVGVPQLENGHARILRRANEKYWRTSTGAVALDTVRIVLGVDGVKTSKLQHFPHRIGLDGRIYHEQKLVRGRGGVDGHEIQDGLDWQVGIAGHRQSGLLDFVGRFVWGHGAPPVLGKNASLNL